MPLVDMPVDQLFQYNGTNPRPVDHDAYWARALAEMHALGTGCERIPADFQVPGIRCEDMYFTGVGGARIYARLLVPEGREGCPAVLHFHGYTGRSEDWHAYVGYAALGFVVAALDCRGQGGKSEDVGGVKGITQRGMFIRGLDDPNPDKLTMRAQFLDTAQLARIVMALPEVDENRVGAYGGSQGGALTLACAALEPRIRRAVPVHPFLCDYKRVWEMDLAIDAYWELRDFFRRYDPQHLREEAIFTRLGYIDIQFLAPRIRADILLLTGLMDTVCPPSTQFAAYNKMICPKQVEFWPDFGHEGLPYAGNKTMQYLLKL